MNATILRRRGRVPYDPVFREMLAFTRERTGATVDEIWLLEHDPVFTLGLAADRAHVHDAHGIALEQTDRGGEVTYHGPGQIVAYLLFDLKRHFPDLHIREFVFRLEAAVIQTLATFGIASQRREGAPGVYLADGGMAGAKIAALGLKVKGSGYMYHGFALNVDMDLAPFSWIDPCGYRGLAVTDMRSAGFSGTSRDVEKVLLERLSVQFGLDIRTQETGGTHG